MKRLALHRIEPNLNGSKQPLKYIIKFYLRKSDRQIGKDHPPLQYIQIHKSKMMHLKEFNTKIIEWQLDCNMLF